MRAGGCCSQAAIDHPPPSSGVSRFLACRTLRVRPYCTCAPGRLRTDGRVLVGGAGPCRATETRRPTGTCPALARQRAHHTPTCLRRGVLPTTPPTVPREK